MLLPTPPAYTVLTRETNRQNLLLLYYLRWIAIIGQITAISIVHGGFNIHLPLLPMGTILLFLTGLNAVTYYAYSTGKPIDDSRLLFSLIVDVLALTAQFYYSGGGSNPFIGLFLLQVIIAATILEPCYTWAVVGITLCCYLVISFFYIEIPHLHHYHLGEFFNLHIHGMFISYGLSAVLVAYFITRMSKNLKARDQSLAKIREQQINEEQSLLLGMLAAGAAHELGTPLSTIAFLAGNYLEEAVNSGQKRRAEILYSEIMRCKEIISQITHKAGASRAASGQPKMLDVFINDIAARFLQHRPDSAFTLTHQSELPAPVIYADYGFEQTVINLLNNAADASPLCVNMQTKWTTTTVTITITDQGKGISPSILASLGQLGTTTKQEGMGMGLYLTASVIRRMRGTFTISNRPNGGAIACIIIPLEALKR